MLTDPPTSSVFDPDATREAAPGDVVSWSPGGKLPTFERRAFPVLLPKSKEALSELSPGRCLGDFELVRELGAGSFGRVYLARQLSLDRMVALKISLDSSGEAQALAALEHDHIVRVFDEVVDRGTGFSLLSMQYVPGATLTQVLDILAINAPGTWTGRDLLNAVAACNPEPVPLDPAAQREREWLAGCDHIETICWLGARLAEALEHAHGQGILHRDIKPSNILLNANGRVLLADFNLAADHRRGQEQTFGGTLNYMAPEHLDALNPGTGTLHEVVDARSDIYSLGVVLFELLTGHRPFADVPLGQSPQTALAVLHAGRLAGAPSPQSVCPDVPDVLDRVVRRCLDPNPQCRYPRAAELAEVLDGCRHLQQWERAFPSAGWLTRLAHASPVVMFVFLGLLPHVVSTLVNIAYNSFAIVSKLTEAQQDTFQLMLLPYNAVVYPLCIWLCCRVMVPVAWTRQRLDAGETLAALDTTAKRRVALQGPRLIVAASCLGWLPGGLLFPLVISLVAGPVPLDVFVHFVVSFTIAGLIATTYCYFGMQGFVLRILYPRLWVDPKQVQRQARAELGRIDQGLRTFQFAAGLIPMSGVMLMVSLGPECQTTAEFHALVVGLICIGMAGFAVALFLSTRSSLTLSVMLGKENQ